jgi:hypothetical protein
LCPCSFNSNSEQDNQYWLNSIIVNTFKCIYYNDTSVNTFIILTVFLIATYITIV